MNGQRMNVLVAVDSSSVYENVLTEVALRPWPAGASLCVLTVVEPSYVWNVPRMENGPQETAENMVHLAVKQLTARQLQAYSVVKQGDPKSVIVDEALRMNADLVILGSRGHSGVTRFLLGSVAETVVRSAACSVEVVRVREREEPDVYRGTRILLATDGSESSENAARSIAARPWLPGSEVNVVSVVELIVPPLHTTLFDSDAMEVSRAEAMTHAQQAIMSAEKIITAAGLKVTETILLPVASVKELILHEAEKWDADLIVLGSHGRHGLERFLIGSVSEAVARNAKCSVEVIRRPAVDIAR
jgi:nucleotide-binding universal stress UspA family protein